MINKNKQGSLMIGSLVIMLIVSATAIAVINRSFQGTILTTDTKKGYIAYQATDSASENFLNDLKTLDNNIAGSEIPENKLASAYCTGDYTCLDKDENDITGSATAKVADIWTITGSATSSSLQRNIQLDVSERIKFDSESEKIDFTTDNCNGSTICIGSSYNNCDMGILLDPSNDTDVTDKIKDYELRRSLSKDLDDTVYGWWNVRIFSGDSASNQSAIIKNGDFKNFPGSEGQQSGGQYGEEYYFTIKARNKNPLSLDSLYWSDGGSGQTSNTKVKLDNTDKCEGSEALENLGCVSSASAPRGTQTLTAKYNCCNGTECWMPSPHWEENGDDDCALEKCEDNQDGYMDTVTVGSSITDGVIDAGGNDGGKMHGLGWCGSAEACKKGESCADPYRTVGYCKTVPANSTQSVSFLPVSGWTAKNIIPVNISSVMSMSPPVSSISKSRCSSHNCPPANSAINNCDAPTDGHGTYSVSGPVCIAATCGLYDAAVTCSLNCDADYYPAETKPSSTTNQVTVKYTNKCCYKTCPANCTSNCQNSPYNCPANPTDGHYEASCTPSCGTYTISCNLVCDSDYHLENGVCVYNTRYDQTCTGLPTNAVWNTASAITQNWVDSSWTSSTSGHYDTSSSTTECHYKCATNYTWNESSCVAATQTANCSSKPANTVWNTVSSITQTWSGGSWSPSVTSTYNTTPSTTQCRYKCASGYTWSGSSCVAGSYQCNRCAYNNDHQRVRYNSPTPCPGTVTHPVVSSCDMGCHHTVTPYGCYSQGGCTCP